ncbi:MAG: response regulator [Roseateles sp.]|uniref:response regulator n=1 Tax=Roseateles sp. TaxID=1971397 RepID=UPI0040351CF0
MKELTGNEQLHPLAETTPAADAAGPQAQPAPAGRLLVLDDDAVVATVLGMAAQRLGFQVELTAHAAAFLERAAAWSPSHVTIDLGMPGMGGVQVLDQLAAAGCRAGVIISSGADAMQIQAALDHARARGLLVIGALAKPFSIAALRELLSG